MTLLKPGDILGKEWLIEKRIGYGSFGEIFAALYLKDGVPPSENQRPREYVAIKVEPINTSRQSVLQLEIKILQQLTEFKIPIAPQFIANGVSKGCTFLVMEHLGENLSTLRHHETGHRFSYVTTLSIAIEMFRSLQVFHTRFGMLHRDIKPGNFCISRYARSPEIILETIDSTLEHTTLDPKKRIGPSESQMRAKPFYSSMDSVICRRRIYMVDYGLARRFADNNGHMRPARTCPGFRGTARYASVIAHEGSELSPVDDLWSAFFVMIENLTGALPWCRLRDRLDIYREKKYHCIMRPDLLTIGLPQCFDSIRNILSTHDYYRSNIDYMKIITILDKERNKVILNLSKKGFKYPGLFDWERNALSLEPLPKYQPTSNYYRSIMIDNKDPLLNVNDDPRLKERHELLEKLLRDNNLFSPLLAGTGNNHNNIPKGKSVLSNQQRRHSMRNNVVSHTQHHQAIQQNQRKKIPSKESSSKHRSHPDASIQMPKPLSDNIPQIRKIDTVDSSSHGKIVGKVATSSNVVESEGRNPKRQVPGPQQPEQKKPSRTIPDEKIPTIQMNYVISQGSGPEQDLSPKFASTPSDQDSLSDDEDLHPHSDPIANYQNNNMYNDDLRQLRNVPHVNRSKKENKELLTSKEKSSENQGKSRLDEENMLENSSKMVKSSLQVSKQLSSAVRIVEITNTRRTEGLSRPEKEQNVRIESPRGNNKYGIPSALGEDTISQLTVHNSTQSKGYEPLPACVFVEYDSTGVDHSQSSMTQNSLFQRKAKLRSRLSRTTHMSKFLSAGPVLISSDVRDLIQKEVNTKKGRNSKLSKHIENHHDVRSDSPVLEDTANVCQLPTRRFPVDIDDVLKKPSEEISTTSPPSEKRQIATIETPMIEEKSSDLDIDNISVVSVTCEEQPNEQSIWAKIFCCFRRTEKPCKEPLDIVQVESL